MRARRVRRAVPCARGAGRAGGPSPVRARSGCAPAQARGAQSDRDGPKAGLEVAARPGCGGGKPRRFWRARLPWPGLSGAQRRRPGRPKSRRAPYSPPGGSGDTPGAAAATAAE